MRQLTKQVLGSLPLELCSSLLKLWLIKLLCQLFFLLLPQLFKTMKHKTGIHLNSLTSYLLTRGPVLPICKTLIKQIWSPTSGGYYNEEHSFKTVIFKDLHLQGRCLQQMAPRCHNNSKLFVQTIAINCDNEIKHVFFIFNFKGTLCEKKRLTSPNPSGTF